MWGGGNARNGPPFLDQVWSSCKEMLLENDFLREFQKVLHIRNLDVSQRFRAVCNGAPGGVLTIRGRWGRRSSVLIKQGKAPICHIASSSSPPRQTDSTVLRVINVGLQLQARG